MNDIALTPVPPGRIATVVTYLEMRAPPAPAAEPTPAPARGGDLALWKVEKPEIAWYRDLYRRVGADWLWFSRLRMAEADLAAILHDPRVEVYALGGGGGGTDGLLELDRRGEPGDVELAFLGVAADQIGTGAGRFLMERAIELAWAPGTGARRFWVHTCTLDHPSALGFYMKAGFVPYARAVEIADDPRLDGTLPRTAAPQVPIIE